MCPASCARWGSGPPRSRPRRRRVLSIRRRDAATRTDYYFFYNQGIVEPAGRARDAFRAGDRRAAWSARSAWKGADVLTCWMPGPARSRRSSTTPSTGIASRVRIRLSRDNGALIAISDSPNRFGIAPPGGARHQDHAPTTPLRTRDAVVIRAAKAGTYTTTLSNGRTVRSTIGDVPAADRPDQGHMASGGRRLAARQPVRDDVREGRGGNAQGPRRSWT